MLNFFLGIASSIVAAALVGATAKVGWPAFHDRILYNGVRVDGCWDIIEERKEKTTTAGQLTLTQRGRRITGVSRRKKRRDGKKSDRGFVYKGRIDGSQVTLLFEDERGVGFDSGSYILVVQNAGLEMVGMATFHGKPENRIISESRRLRKVVS